MKNISTLLVTGVLMLLGTQIYGQIYDFEDAVIPNAMQGDRANFQVSSSNQLQLNAPAGSTTSSLSWPSINTQNCSWEFYVNYAFAASATNYATFYLLSTEANFASASNVSYCLKIGGSTGVSDKIELIYQQGSTKQVVLESRSGIVGGSQVTGRIQVVKSSAGLWELRIDSSGGYNYLKEAHALHWITNSFNYSGIRCVYSSTRRDKFYFDDISIHEPFAIQSYIFENDSTIKIHFNRRVSVSSQPIIAINFDVPYTTVIDSNYVQLCFSRQIYSGIYSGTINNIYSSDGDLLLDGALEIIKELTYYVGQIRISEWMSDPSPSYGLPEVEWVELVNMSNQSINLDKISISDPSSKVRLPSYLLSPDSVVIVCSLNTCHNFSKQNCIEVSSLPSLNNSSDSIFIWANDSLLLDFVCYDISVMLADFRRDGGYSIIRKEYPEDCFMSETIDFTKDNRGGTPGVISDVIIHTTPTIEAITVSDREININMNVRIHGWNTSFYASLGVDHALNKTNVCGTSYALYLNQRLEAGNAYNFRLDSIRTCRNQMKCINAEIEIIYPKQIERNEVFVNEILYNPNSGGVDFIEMYNATSKYVQLQDSHLYNETKGILQHMHLSGNTVIKPFDFAILTPDTAILKQQYNNALSTNMFQLKSFLSLPDTGGKVIWLNKDGDTLDQVFYGDSYHNPLLRNTEGYSLEKISSSESHFSSANWATSAVYATPGYINSQHVLTSGIQQKTFYCNPCHVTTNLNGINDFAVLHLGEKVQGCFGSIGIYRLSGEKVIDLVVNQSLGTVNAFQWNGQQQGGSLLEDGIYIAVAEWWSSNGQTYVSKIAISTSQY